MRVLVGILFVPIAFEGLRDITIFLTSVSSSGWEKKECLFLELPYVSSNVHKIFVKSIGYFLWLVKPQPLSKVLDGAILANSFKEISFPVLFKSLGYFWNNL